MVIVTLEEELFARTTEPDPVETIVRFPFTVRSPPASWTLPG
jgi:hypothetical protein